MEEFDFNPKEKEFIVNGKAIKRNVKLDQVNVYNVNGKETITVLDRWLNPYKILYDYDEDGNLKHKQVIMDNNSFDDWYEYDSEGNMIYMKTAKGDEVFYEYDDAGNCIGSKASTGIEFQYSYIGNKKIYEIDSAYSEMTIFQYDKNDNCIRALSTSGKVKKNTYDLNNNLILSVSSDGYVEYYEYDNNGNMTYSVSGLVSDKEIDAEEYELDLNKLNESETFFEYDFYPNGSVQREYIYQTFKS